MLRIPKNILSILMIMVMTFSVFSIQTETTYAAKSKAKVSIKSYNYPKTINAGKNFTIKGKIKSSKKIKRVEIGIVKASTNKWTSYKYDNKKVGAKTFNVKKARKKLKFNKLTAGTYYYRIYVHTSSGAKIVLNKKFAVNAVKKAERIAVVKKNSATKQITELMPTAASKDASASVLNESVKLTGYNHPTKLANGEGYSVKGKITCNNTIRRVEIGIVVTATNKWSEYKYDNTAVNAKEFDVSKAASALKFEKLPGGNFTYRIYVHTDKAVYIALNQSFTSDASNVPQLAINWATAIANNDAFSYGKGYGKYSTCCVCANKTEKKSDAQFTCMPFLAAAYAHASADPRLMNSGYHVMYLHDKNFKGNLGEAWFKLGLCKDLTIADLQPGDVIIQWSSTDNDGHAWMYGGGDSVIEAVSADIRVVKKGAANKLYKCGFTDKRKHLNYVMRFRN